MEQSNISSVSFVRSVPGNNFSLLYPHLRKYGQTFYHGDEEALNLITRRHPSKINFSLAQSPRKYETSILRTLFESPIILSLSVILALFYITILSHNRRREERHHILPEIEMESEEESKELGIISKKLGIAREVITIIAESFNKAAHDLELANALHSIFRGSAEPGGGRHQEKNNERDPIKPIKEKSNSISNLNKFGT